MPEDPLTARLRAAGCVWAEDEAALMRGAGGDLEAMVARRVGGEPLEQVLGWAAFRGLRVAVAPGVFVPRPRTALLVDLALPLLPGGGVLLDLCCGSGALGLAVATRRPDVTVHAADLDAAAVACARRNLGARVYRGDLWQAVPVSLRGGLDVVLANVPYVPSAAVELLPREAREHEPRRTLDGGPDGLDVLRRVLAGAGGWLRPGGWLLSEIDAGQAAAAKAAVRDAGLQPHVHTDGRTDTTAVLAHLPGPPPENR